MPIQFTCPSCRKALSVPEEYAGATGPCPSCGAQVSVPVLPQAPLAPGTAPPPQVQPITVQPTPGAAPPPSPQFATPPAMVGQPMAMPIREAGPRTSPAAIWSLALSLASYVFCLNVFTAIPGLIVGIAARRSVAASQGRLKGGGMATAGILLSLLAILLTVVGGVGLIVAVPKFTASVQESIQQLEIQTEGARLHRDCMVYGSDHAGELPPDLAALSSGGYSRRRPSRRTIQFEYLGAGHRIDDPGNRIILYARQADSQGRRSVVRLNGQIESMSESQLRTMFGALGVPAGKMP